MRNIKTVTSEAYIHRGYCVGLLIILFLSAASASEAQPPRLAASYYNRGNER